VVTATRALEDEEVVLPVVGGRFAVTDLALAAILALEGALFCIRNSFWACFCSSRSCFFFSYFTQASSRASCRRARRSWSRWILSRSSPYVNLGRMASHALRLLSARRDGGRLGFLGSGGR